MLGFPANELWGNREPVCPYCNKKQDADDCRMGDQEVDEWECGSCERKFIVQSRIEREFDTVGDCKLNGETHELKLTFDLDNTKLYQCVKCKGEVYDWQLPGGKHPRLEPGEFTILPRTRP